jgi:hypothetical protein
MWLEYPIFFLATHVGIEKNYVQFNFTKNTYLTLYSSTFKKWQFWFFFLET